MGMILWYITSLIGICVMAVTCAMAGAVSAFKSLEYTEVTRHEDGIKKTYMTLCLGPFEYKFEIPKKKEIKENEKD